MKLVIAIPALNEQDSIDSIIGRTLAARDRIIEQTPVTDVGITVISDGSTDRTVEIASKHGDAISLIVFEKNQGYGAAIKAGWDRSDAELLGFLDADGTCDPDFFVPLCNALLQEDADVVLGCRLTPESRMPLIRRSGNRIFATILSILSSSMVRDTASGMRVVRRSSLVKLLPLPDGLHFTPAMSARAMLRDDTKIIEIPMPYHEREGRSKLNPGKDGVRFLRVILETAFLYRASRPLELLGAGCIAVAMILMGRPIFVWVWYHRVEEWMIYRFLVSHLLGASGILLVCAGYLCDRLVEITVSRHPSHKARRGVAAAFFSSRTFWVTPIALLGLGLYLVVPSIVSLYHTGHTYLHWSRFVAMSFVSLVAVILIGSWTIHGIMNLIAAQMAFLDRMNAAPEPEAVPSAAAQPV